MVPLAAGTYLLKAVDSTGNESAEAAAVAVVVSRPELYRLNVVATIDEDPDWAGDMDGVYAEAGNLRLTGTLDIDDVELISALGDWDTAGGVAAAGIYSFANSLDLGGVYTSRVRASVNFTGYVTDLLVDSRLDDISAWASWDGTSPDGLSAKIEMRFTEDDPAGSPAWSDWVPVLVADVRARAFEFRLVLASDSPTHNLEVSAAGVTVDMPDRVESGQNVSIASGGTTLSYTEPFKAVPGVTVSLSGSGVAAGDWFKITNETVSGFKVTIYDSGGSTKAGTIGWLSKGYGRKVA